MTKEDKDKASDVLKIRKKDDLKELDEEMDEMSKREEEREERRRRDKEEIGSDAAIPPPPPPPGSIPPPPPPGGYPPPPPPHQSEPMMSAKKLHKFMAIGILIGIMILFVGTLLIISANFMDPYEEDDADDLDKALDLQRNVANSGRLISSIGLFLTGLFIVIPFMMIRDLSDMQRAMLVIIIAAIILAFSFLV